MELPDSSRLEQPCNKFLKNLSKYTKVALKWARLNGNQNLGICVWKALKIFVVRYAVWYVVRQRIETSRSSGAGHKRNYALSRCTVCCCSSGGTAAGCVIGLHERRRVAGPLICEGVKTLPRKFGNVFVTATKSGKLRTVLGKCNKAVNGENFTLILDSNGGLTNPSLYVEILWTKTMSPPAHWK
jgi:hypothetical protein